MTLSKYTVVNGRASVQVLGFSADGTRLLTKGAGVDLYDAKTGDKIERLNPEFERFSAEFMGDFPQLVAVGSELIEFYDLEGELLSTWTADPGESTAGFAALWESDAFALAQQDGINFYRMSDGVQYTQLPNSAGMSQVVSSADGTTLAAYHKESDRLHVWPLANISNAITISEADSPQALHLSNDGQRLAAFNDRGAFVWETATGSVLMSVEKLEFEVDELAFSADGTTLAVGYSDGYVEVWSVADEAIVQLFQHPRSLYNLALSPDGSMLAVGLHDDAIVTNVTPEDRAAIRLRANSSNPNGAQFLTSSTPYIETQPGFAIVWEIAP